ncbi:MAG: PEP/pyruvate-binding domain-containing protein [Bdellovibrionales bacterium]
MKYIFAITYIILSAKAGAVEINGHRRALFNNGERCGTVSVITSEESHEFEALNVSSIPVFTFFPSELSTVAGVVTLVKQPRSSHIALKAKDWGIPNADISGAECVMSNSDDLLGAFAACMPNIKDGDYIYMKVQKEGRILTVEKTMVGDPRCPVLVTKIGEVEITADLTHTALSDHKDLGWKDFDKVGSKAANYAELMHAMNAGGEEVVRPGFAIPFYYYNQFIDENVLVKSEIESILSDKKLNDPLEAIYRGERLLRLQALIMSEKVKVNETFLAQVYAKAETFRGVDDKPRKLKFRSSTNAEDLPSFSGAGLYDSKSYKPLKNSGEERKASKKLLRLEESIKTVWASIWNKRAYDERAFYGIDHSQVYMGIQVNLSFSDEIASGVVVTKNAIDPDGVDGTYIEAQRGDEYSVENPSPGVLAERILIEHGIEGESAIKRLGNSTVDVDGLTVLAQESTAPVLTDADILRIDELSYTAEQYFEKLLGEEGREFALDIEFKVDLDLEGVRTVYFKQARPYLIHDK